MTSFICIHPEPYDLGTVFFLQKRFGISELLAKALIRRGILTEADALAFLSPQTGSLSDPFLLPDMRLAVERIQTALFTRERICVYGDYDADGVCATAILLRFLRDKTDLVRAYIPSRHDEGYGINADAVRQLAQEGTQLIITVDNGISASQEIALCHSLGVDVIVTDHHRVGESLPDCCAVVSAMRQDSAYPDSNLCGAGIALQLVRALLDGQSAPDSVLAFAAIATIADAVPLLGENRILAATGLPLAANQTGLSALMRAGGLSDAKLTSTSAAYTVVPRLNAAGRMGDAAIALQLLLTDDAEECVCLAQKLHAINEARREAETAVLRAAEEMILSKALLQDKAILVFGNGWNKGVLGIVAARIAEKYYRPAIAFAEDDSGVLHGSGRSITGIDLFQSLSACSKHFLRFGGHAGAAGITMRASEFEPFRSDLCLLLETNYSPDIYEKKLYYEQRISISECNRTQVQELQKLAPFGEGNPEPVFYIDNALLHFGKRMGKDGAHFSAELVQNGDTIRLIAFGFGEACDRLADSIAKDVLATVSLRSYMGKESVELFAKEICAHDSRILKFYDAISEGILYNIKRVSFEEALFPSLTPIASVIANEDYSTETMRTRYQMLRRMLAGEGLPVSVVYNRLALATLISLTVFIELGFFVLDVNGTSLCAVKECKTQPLQNSSVYRFLLRCQ